MAISTSLMANGSSDGNPSGGGIPGASEAGNLWW